MSINLSEDRSALLASRRGFLGATGTLSAVAVAMLAGTRPWPRAWAANQPRMYPSSMWL